MLFASTQTAIGGVVLFSALVIVITYAAINIRLGRKEIGSEIELAPNRRPYYSDEELEKWVPTLNELAQQSEQAYAFFNNNNQTNGVAQAPAGALLLRKLLEEESIPTA